MKHCSVNSCDELWNPYKEEQRYCHDCDAWFHTNCLANEKSLQQDVHRSEVHSSVEYAQVPKIILDIAFQPTARGGLIHFAAGNIRIVRFARSLVDSNAREQVSSSHDWFVAHSQEVGEDITEDDWMRFMEEQQGMEEKNRGVGRFEQLLVGDQTMFSCPLCTKHI